MGTRALITGIGGFAGYHLAELLLKEGYEVSGFDRCAEDAERVKALGSRIRYLCADMTNLEQVEHAVQEAKPEVVFHLAGISHVGETWNKRRLTFEVNFLGTMNVLDTIRKFCRKAVAVLVGSGEQYGNVPLERQPIREEEPLFPRSPYGVSKAAQEMLGRQYAASDWMEVVLIRAFNHCGAFQEPTFVTSDFASQIALAEAGRREPVLRVGNLDVRRDFTDVRDMVRGYLLAGRRARSGDIFNLSSGRGLLLTDIVEMLRKMAKVPIEVIPESDRFRPVDIPILSGDNSKARKALGWAPEIPFSETLQWILDYWRERV